MKEKVRESKERKRREEILRNRKEGEGKRQKIEVKGE